jgi:polyphosphate glucokinase
MRRAVLGIDIDGARVRAAPVDVDFGELIDEAHSEAVPPPGSPAQLLGVIGRLADRFAWCGPIGIAFPGVIEHGVVRTAAHLDATWIGAHVESLVEAGLGAPTTAINDADAAGLAEIRFGAAVGHRDVVAVVTLGTGVGTAVFIDGVLLPNTEFGHLPIDGADGEQRIDADALDRRTWEAWAADLDTYLQLLERLIWPNLLVIGGSISEHIDRFAALLHTRTPLVAAQYRAQAGIVGAALHAARAVDRVELAR